MLWSYWLRAQVLIHEPLTLPHRGGHGRLGIPFIHLKSPLLLQNHTTHSVVNRVIKHTDHQERIRKRIITAGHGFGRLCLQSTQHANGDKYIELPITESSNCRLAHHVSQLLPEGVMCKHMWQVLPVKLKPG